MTTQKYLQIKAREKANKEQLLQCNPYLNDNSGIYILRRKDEEGILYAYVGQAKHILTRLAQHLDGYEQHIDLSLKKHGLFGMGNYGGWTITAHEYPVEDLDDMERKYIRQLARQGYQLRNKTIGGQNKGKVGIAENKPAKGYYDGIKTGRKQVIKELRKIVKYLDVAPHSGKLAERMAERFNELLKE